MSDRLNFYFRQRVTEAELDLAFEQLEAADHALASDLGVFGVIAGAEPRQHEPLADLTLDLTAPVRAYDRLGQRIFVGVEQRVDCAVDHQGLPTAVTRPRHARWLAVFLRFQRQVSDPRTDGNAQQVFFRRDEGFSLAVYQAPEAPEESTTKVPLQDDALLLCDVRLRHGQARILNEDIDLTRRQSFVFAHADALAVETGLWKLLKPRAGSVQASFDALDDLLQNHLSGRGLRHRASEVDFTPAAGLRATDLQAAVQELIAQLAAADATPGSRRIGARTLAGTPLALPAGRVDDHLEKLHAALNEHLTKPAAAHAASAIEAAPHGPVQGRSVQAQLQEILTLLASRLPDQGAALIGNASLAGSPRGVIHNTVRGQLTQLLSHLNEHIRSDDHDARYWLRGQPVDDANRLQGLDAAAFARADHQHDDRYPRRVFFQLVPLNAGEQRDVTTLRDRPDVVSLSYMTATNTASDVTVFAGEHTSSLQAWVTRIATASGGSDYKITVRNNSPVRLFVRIVAFNAG
jgi:hypothetical protein